MLNLLSLDVLSVLPPPGYRGRFGGAKQPDDLEVFGTGKQPDDGRDITHSLSDDIGPLDATTLHLMHETDSNMNQYARF